MVMVRVLKKCYQNKGMRRPGDVYDHQGPIPERLMIAIEDEVATKKPRVAKVAKATQKKVPPKAKAVDDLLTQAPKTDSE